MFQCNFHVKIKQIKALPKNKWDIKAPCNAMKICDLCDQKLNQHFQFVDNFYFLMVRKAFFTIYWVSFVGLSRSHSSQTSTTNSG